MGEQNIERLSILPLAIAIMAILITIVGGTVRIHDAGESCPDWPTCFGTLGFDISSEEQEVWWNDNPDEIDSRGEHHRYTTFEIFVEWFHRLLVGIIAIPIILNVLFVNKKRLRLGERVRSLAIFSAILLLVQALAGYATVKFDNADWTVAVHLTLASTFIAVLIWQWMSWIRVINPDRAVFSLTKKEAEKMKLSVIVMLFSMLILLVLGAWVSSTATGNYNQACSVGGDAWPLCQGELIPDLSQTPILVQMIHRIAVVIVGLVMFVGYRKAKNELPADSYLTRTIAATFHLWATNLVVGGMYLLTATEGFIEWLSLLHLVLGVLTFITIAISAMLIDIALRHESKGEEE